MTVIAGLGATILGLMAFALYPDLADPRDALIGIAQNDLPFIIGLFILCGVLGAGLSTANGGALAVSAVFGRNIFHRNILLPYERRKAAQVGRSLEDMNVDWHELDRKLLNYARLMLIPIFAAAWWLAIVRPEPGVLLVLAFDVVFAGCLAPLVVRRSSGPRQHHRRPGVGRRRLRLAPVFFLGIPRSSPVSTR